MLLSFSVCGYKIFDSRVDFSMIANNKNKKLMENTAFKKIKGKDYFILKSAVLYGPNNSGKTAFIKSISILKNIIEKESIDEVSSNIMNFNFFDSKKKIEFEIGFLYNDKIYNYELSFNEKNEITKEKLIVDAKVILDRFGKNNKKVTQVLELLGHYKNKLMVMTLPKDYDTYYLDFKGFFSKLIIFQYVDNDVKSTIEMMNDDKYKDEFIKLIKKSDINIKEIKINNKVGHDAFMEVPSENNDYLRLESTYEKNGKIVSFPSILVDSLGTKKLIVYASYIIKALKEQHVLIIDELDSSWHTVLTRNIFALFNSTSNQNSQLIASCHDLLLLDDNNMFRRDQIWFTYKDKTQTYFYSLNDFKNAGSNKMGATISNYLKGMYGALPYPDLGDIVNE